MATTKKTTPAPAKKTAVAKRPTGAVAETNGWGHLAGAGFQSQTRDDITLPFISILADNPSMEGVKGAKNGLWFNTVTQEVYGSDVVVVPVYTEKAFVEWRPDRGGFAGVHAPSSEVVAAAKHDAAEAGRKFNELFNGENALEETIYVYCLILADADDSAPKEFAVLAFKSTWIKVYRKANTAWRTRPGLPPLFSNRVRLTSKLHNDGKFKWWVPVVSPAVGDTWEDSSLPTPGNPADPSTWHPLLAAGKDMEQQVEQGLVRPAFETEAPASGAPEGASTEGSPF